MKFNIKIDGAIAAVEKNLNDHVAELAEANQEWTKQVIAALNGLRDAVTRKGYKASYEEVQRLFYARPQDTRAQYSKYLSALRRAKADGQDIITVDEDDHDRIFNDNWEWRVISKTSNAAYSRK